MTSTILVTGGTGYIGSHTTVLLLQAGYRVLILDNFCNSDATVLDRIERICGIRPDIVEGDIRDAGLLESLFARHPITAIMHFAGLKAVGESTQQPLEYYSANVGGSVCLLQAAQNAGVKTFVSGRRGGTVRRLLRQKNQV